jgi:hypothetical protein
VESRGLGAAFGDFLDFEDTEFDLLPITYYLLPVQCILHSVYTIQYSSLLYL